MSSRRVSLDKIKQIFPAVIFIAIVLLDMLQGQWEFFNTNERLQWLQLLKLSILVVIGINAIKSYRILIFIVSSLVISVAIGYNKEFFRIELLQHLVKYLSPFIYYYGFKALLDSKLKKKALLKACLILIYIGIFSILIGMIFGVDSFQTYSNRFGYKGLFKRSIDVSYFLVYSILYISLFRTYIKGSKVLIAIVFLSAFVAGTKVPLLFLALYLAFVFFKNKQLRKPILIFSIPIGLVSAGLIYLVLPDKVMYTFELFYSIYQQNGIFSSLTSFRSDLLLQAIEYYKNHWSWQNVFFGGQSFNTELVEMSLPDLVVFFGFLGATLYSFFYYNVYFKNGDKNFQSLYAIVIIASIFAGQFFFNPTVTIWFAVLTVLVHSEKSDNSMRIFLISNMYPSKKNTSYGVFVQNTVNALEKSGVVFSKKSVLRGRASSRIAKLLRYILYYLGIINHYLFGNFDIIYVHFLSHNTPVLYFILKLLGKKKLWVINVHGSDVVQSEGKKIDDYNYLILQKSDLIIAPSQSFAERMEKQYPNVEATKYYISPSGGINSSVFYPSESIRKVEEKLTIGFVSRIDEGKGWDVFLDAIHFLKEDNINFQAIIAGGGAEIEKLKNHITHLDLENQVEYLGNLTQLELGEVYRNLDLFVFSTVLDESLGLVAIEAMACGVPVIGSEIPGIKSYLNHQENGFCFKPGESKELALQVKRFLSLSKLDKNKMIKAAIETGMQYDSIAVNARLYNKFEALYKTNN